MNTFILGVGVFLCLALFGYFFFSWVRKEADRLAANKYKKEKIYKGIEQIK